MATTRNRIPRAVLTLALASAALVPATALAQAEPQFTREFEAEDCHFLPHGRQNPFFSLNPGDQLTLEGEEDGEEVRVEITVTNRTRRITFRTAENETVSLDARVVVEKEWVDGEIVEISRNFFARCRQTSDIFYFGESVDIYEDGEVVSHEGAWRAGIDGAQPGIIMPGRFLLGSRYFQELAPGVALDRAEHVAMGLTVTAAGETFDDCVRIVETSPLEPGHESVKVYCPDVGLVQDGAVTLTDFRRE